MGTLSLISNDTSTYVKMANTFDSSLFISRHEENREKSLCNAVFLILCKPYPFGSSTLSVWFQKRAARAAINSHV